MLSRFQWYRKLQGGYWLLTVRGWERVCIDEWVHYGAYALDDENWTKE